MMMKNPEVFTAELQRPDDAMEVNATLEKAARIVEAEQPPMPHLALIAAAIRALKVAP